MRYYRNRICTASASVGGVQTHRSIPHPKLIQGSYSSIPIAYSVYLLTLFLPPFFFFSSSVINLLTPSFFCPVLIPSVTLRYSQTSWAIALQVPVSKWAITPVSRLTRTSRSRLSRNQIRDGARLLIIMIRINWSGWERSRFFEYDSLFPLLDYLLTVVAQLWIPFYSWLLLHHPHHLGSYPRPVRARSEQWWYSWYYL